MDIVIGVVSRVVSLRWMGVGGVKMVLYFFDFFDLVFDWIFELVNNKIVEVVSKSGRIS